MPKRQFALALGKLLAFSLAEGPQIITISAARMTAMQEKQLQSIPYPMRKFVKVAVLAAMAAGSLISVSCCAKDTPAPKHVYVKPSK